MAKLVIGKSTPKSFPLKVEVPTPTGLDTVNFVAKHMPSTAWAKMREAHADTIGKAVQELFDAARDEAEEAYRAQPDPVLDGGQASYPTKEEREAAITALIKPVKESTIAELRAQHSADLIHQIVLGWDLDADLTVPALVDMCDSYPGAAEAVFKAYNETREGLRLGN